MKYRLAGASYRMIAAKLTEDRANTYADANGISFERAMKKVKHVSTRTAWDDVLAEFEGLRLETELMRGDAMAMENARLDQLFSKALSLYSKGSVPAGRLALSIMGRRAKLNGLDAPTKIAPTDPTGELGPKPDGGDGQGGGGGRAARLEDRAEVGGEQGVGERGGPPPGVQAPQRAAHDDRSTRTSKTNPSPRICSGRTAQPPERERLEAERRADL